MRFDQAWHESGAGAVDDACPILRDLDIRETRDLMRLPSTSSSPRYGAAPVQSSTLTL